MADAKNKPLAGLDFSCLLNVDAASLIQLIASRLVAAQGPAVAPTAQNTDRVQVPNGAGGVQGNVSSASSVFAPPPLLPLVAVVVGGAGGLVAALVQQQVPPQATRVSQVMLRVAAMALMAKALSDDVR